MHSGNKIWPVYVVLQNNFFLSKNSTKNVAWKLAPGPLNWPNLINGLYLLLKLFSEMYFLFYAQALDDVMEFGNMEF